MRILSININDFGGINEHLMQYKYFHNKLKRECIDWRGWSKINKHAVLELFFEYLEEKRPDILVVNEMLISSFETIDLISEIMRKGYTYYHENVPKGNYSFTMMFYKNVKCKLQKSPNENHRAYRSVLCEIGDILIYGTHFPQESDSEFLKDVNDFYDVNQEKKLLIIGDLNANNPNRRNKQLVNMLIEKGAVDVWIAKGNLEDTPTEVHFKGRLDYAISTPALFDIIQHIEIDSHTIECGMTDHAAIIVEF